MTDFALLYDEGFWFALFCLVFVMFLRSALVFKKFDELLKYLYSHHQDEWEYLGKPTGYFWSPTETGFFRSVFCSNADSVISRTKTLYSWMFKAPAWVLEDKSAYDIYMQYRKESIISAGLVIIILIIVIASILLDFYS